MSGLDLRPSFSDVQAAFGVPGVVTRPEPNDEPIETTVVWVNSSTLQFPDGAPHVVTGAYRVLGLASADVPTVPRDTVIDAPLTLAGDTRRWRKVADVQVDAPDERRIVVVESE